MRVAYITMRALLQSSRRIASNLLIALPVLFLGCSEERISLNEFLAMQEEQRAAAAASQPADAVTSQPALTEEIENDLGPYRLGPGDTISVSHYGTATDAINQAMTLRIDRDGNIELPVAGKLRLAGMDLVEADRAVQT